MPKRLIKKYFPNHKTIKGNKHLKVFGSLLHDQNLWHLNRRSFAGAIAVGLFIAFVPLPTQMLFAAALAILLRVNLPVSVGTVWISNPLTMPPIFYAAYRTGSWLMNLPAEPSNPNPSFGTILASLEHNWQPFLLGCLFLATLTSALGYLFVRVFWRWFVLNKWSKRKKKPNT